MAVGRAKRGRGPWRERAREHERRSARAAKLGESDRSLAAVAPTEARPPRRSEPTHAHQIGRLRRLHDPPGRSRRCGRRAPGAGAPSRTERRGAAAAAARSRSPLFLSRRARRAPTPPHGTAFHGRCEGLSMCSPPLRAHAGVNNDLPSTWKGKGGGKEASVSSLSRRPSPFFSLPLSLPPLSRPARRHGCLRLPPRRPAHGKDDPIIHLPDRGRHHGGRQQWRPVRRPPRPRLCPAPPPAALPARRPQQLAAADGWRGRPGDAAQV